ncbi:MAG: M48 family metalloprotease [Actinobacteria bacterium]|nr:M48 family metalloprotease [Actinomycetota bacterium]
MSIARALLAIALLAVTAAGTLALVSRTPASIRAEAREGSTDPALGSTFTDDQVASHGAYRGPAYIAYFLTLLINLAVLIVLARGPLATVLEKVGSASGGWIVQTLIASAFVALSLWLATLPLDYVRSQGMGRAWGLSTQDTAGWLSDQLRGAGIGLVIAAIAAIAFFGVVRWQPKAWWWIGWLTFSALSAVLVFLWPLVIAPLFNRFTPLEAGPLRDRVVTLAADAGVEVGDVLVSDASRRTTAENAYVAGLFGSKQLVLYDTLIENGDEDETAFVVAHELGHKVENHVAQGVALSVLGLFLSFVALRWLASTEGPWRWAGASGIGDIRALPVLLLFALVATFVAMPIENAISRRNEAAADRIAIGLTEDPATATKVFRRLAFSNISDLRPPGIAMWLFFTHPPTPDRIDELMVGLGPKA